MRYSPKSRKKRKYDLKAKINKKSNKIAHKTKICLTSKVWKIYTNKTMPEFLNSSEILKKCIFLVCLNSKYFSLKNLIFFLIFCLKQKIFKNFIFIWKFYKHFIFMWKLKKMYWKNDLFEIENFSKYNFLKKIFKHLVYIQKFSKI